MVRVVEKVLARAVAEKAAAMGTMAVGVVPNGGGEEIPAAPEMALAKAAEMALREAAEVGQDAAPAPR